MNKFELGNKKSFSGTQDFNENDQWDIFISSYNLSERIRFVYNKINALDKIWLIAPEYELSGDELPSEKAVITSSRDEGEIIRSLFAFIDVSSNPRICIDATGFVRQHLLCLIRFLFEQNVNCFHVFYSEPERYKQKEKTLFSGGAINEVRQVRGFEGEIAEGSDDLLIIGSGYDNRMIAKVAETKSNCKIVQMVGFPPLRPDMYQENLIRIAEAENYIDLSQIVFAPANDPFVTACVLKDTVEKCQRLKPIHNLYLCPLNTKAQVLGFAIFYIADRIGTASSVIYPPSEIYSKDTTVGISKIWKYYIEL